MYIVIEKNITHFKLLIHLLLHLKKTLKPLMGSKRLKNLLDYVIRSYRSNL